MECETDAKGSKAGHFFEKHIKKGPKIHCLALELYTGPPNCTTGGHGGAGWGSPSGSASVINSQKTRMLVSIVSCLKSLAHLISCEIWRSVVSLNVVSIRQREPSSDNIWNKISIVRHLLLKVRIKFSVYKQTTNQPTNQADTTVRR